MHTQDRMKDYIVIGFGISGLSICKALENFSRDFVIFTDQSQQATKAAGGLINPVMLTSGKLVGQIHEYLPFAKSFYRNFGSHYFTEYPIHKVFNSIAEQNNYLTQMNASNEVYLSTSLVKAYNFVNAPFKMSHIQGGGVLQIQQLLEDQFIKLQSQNKLMNETFDYSELHIHDEYIAYKGLKAKNIIFSEGFGVASNPFFQGLPLQGNKGEYLVVLSEDLQLEAILKNKYFLIPLGNDIYKYGATYHHHDLSNTPNPAAKDELVKSLRQLITCPFEVIDQVAGIRPTTGDKKPIYGTHKIHPKVHIFNGMGSRGLLMAPLLAKELIDNIELNKPLRKEVALSRFKNF